MATRSNIAIKNSDGTVEAIYCHWDGYPENNGVILLEHYTDEAKIRELISLGDLSSLSSEIGEKHNFNSNEHRNNNWCKAYGRDRGEENVGKKDYADVQQWLCYGEEYNYLFDNGKWICFAGDEEIDMKEVLEYA
jgi:hypothetical protein